MMIEKECGIVENATFPSIWELDSQTGTADRSVVDDVDKMDRKDSDKHDAGTVIGLLVTVRALPDRCRVECLLM